jgi:8-amino-7-oxononanoate synthase
VVRSESWRRERLGALTRRFRTRAAQAGVPLGESLTPIQPIILGSAAAALVAQRELEAAGFLVVAIRPPTVPAGSTRLRVTLCATHSERQIDELVEQLGSIAERTRRDGTRV